MSLSFTLVLILELDSLVLTNKVVSTASIFLVQKKYIIKTENGSYLYLLYY